MFPSSLRPQGAPRARPQRRGEGGRCRGHVPRTYAAWRPTPARSGGSLAGAAHCLLSSARTHMRRIRADAQAGTCTHAHMQFLHAHTCTHALPCARCRLHWHGKVRRLRYVQRLCMHSRMHTYTRALPTGQAHRAGARPAASAERRPRRHRAPNMAVMRALVPALVALASLPGSDCVPAAPAFAGLHTGVGK